MKKAKKVSVIASDLSSVLSAVVLTKAEAMAKEEAKQSQPIYLSKILAFPARNGYNEFKLREKMPEHIVYAYMCGERDLVSERVSIILEVLGLKVTSKSNNERKRKIEV